MSRILAIDPGPAHSAYVLLEGREVLDRAIEPNLNVLPAIKRNKHDCLAVEWLTGYGMAVGASVFETCFWCGRFIEAARSPYLLIPRHVVKRKLCGTPKARDSNVRAAIIGLYGGDRPTAIGTKKKPGPLYGIKRDMWAALAVAIVAACQLDSATNVASCPEPTKGA